MAQARGNRQGQRNRQGQQGQQAQQPRQELSMNNALATLKSMFDTVDDNVIRMVLVEGCSGNMEQAVEALLRITEASSGDNNTSNNNNNNNNSSSTNNGTNNSNNAPAAFGLPQPSEDAVRAAKPRRQNNNRGNVNKQQNRQEMTQQLAQRAQNHQQRQRQQQAQHHHQQQQQEQGRVVNLPDDFLRPPSYYLSRFPKERRQDVPNSGRRDPDPNFDAKTEREKQIIEDEIFAKAIFEDAIFTQDLMNHPEWMGDSNNNSEEFNPNNTTWRARSQSNANNNNKSKSPFAKNPFRNKRSQSTTNVNNNDDIDPSNPQARKAKFKQNFEMFGDAAKLKMMNLASKLQRNKDDKRKGTKNNGSASPAAAAVAGPSYGNALKSIDDETLIDDADDALEIDVATEQNRGTYKPPKPAQAL